MGIPRWLWFAWVALTLIVRGRTFIAPLSDGAVGLYLHIAAGMLHGTLPYVGTWEYKPPGSFVPYALALAATGSLTAAPILVGIIAVFSTAVLLFCTAKALDAQRGSTVGVYASLLYLLLSSEEDSLTGDVELLVAPLALCALLLMRKTSVLPGIIPRCFLAGFFAGAALQMKLTALPTVLFLFAMMVWARPRPMVALIAGAAGLMLPIVVEIAWYAHAGFLPELYDANVGATLRRLSFRPSEHAHGQGILLEQLRLTAPVLELAVIGFFAPHAFRGYRGVPEERRLNGPDVRESAVERFSKSHERPSVAPRERRSIAPIWVWLVVQSSALVLVGEYDYRQFIPLLAPIALLGGLGLDIAARRASRPRVCVLAMMLLCFGLHDYDTVRRSVLHAYHALIIHDPYEQENGVMRAARLLPGLVGDSRSLFLVNASPVLYDVLHVVPPTRYSFTPNLFDRSKWAMLGFDGSDELMAVLRKHPEYVYVTDLENIEFDRKVVERFRTEIARGYKRIASNVGGTIDGGDLYRLLPRGQRRQPNTAPDHLQMR